eukprot:47871-Rhodomonas_salina.1
MAAQMTPGRIRVRITQFLATKEMTQTEFLRQCSINKGSLHGFMKLKGKHNGWHNQTYRGALQFFEDLDAREKVEKADKKRKAREDGIDVDGEAKRRKREGEDLINSALGVQLPTDAIFENCDEVRQNGLAFIAENGVTKTAFFRGASMNSNSWNQFLQTKGPEKGRDNEAYRKTFLFLEKVRIFRGLAKTAKRLQV